MFMYHFATLPPEQLHIHRVGQQQPDRRGCTEDPSRAARQPHKDLLRWDGDSVRGAHLENSWTTDLFGGERLYINDGKEIEDKQL